MKVIRILDQSETKLLSDLLNQLILRELVVAERSVSGLAKKLDSPVLKLWRRMQKLESAGLIEVSRTQKSGNIETKMYRATATSYVPQQFFEFKPKDPLLLEAFEIYSEFRKRFAALLASSNEIPPGADPVDYSIYASMQAFAKVHGERGVQQRVSELEQKLSEFKRVEWSPAVSRA
ncbi:MAG TPA: winged helix-turn-helix domain-containing protein [Nitrososphaerales archaeon]|nr:winged helix-turn-helix domain-containing protein [Nitrososphaerales archaeon]